YSYIVGGIWGPYILRNATAWRVHGSLNNVDWDLLDTQTGITSWAEYEQKSFDLSAKATYRYFRITIDANNGENRHCFIGTLNYLGAPSITGDFDKLETTEPIKDGDNLVIVKDDNSVHEIVASGVTVISGTPLGDVTETMTSNSQNGHTVVASSVFNDVGSYDAYRAFDGSTTNQWYSNADSGKGWLTYEFPAPIRLDSYRIAPHNGSVPKNSLTYITTWAFEGWNGIDWDVLHLQDIPLTATSGVFYEYSLTASGAYTKYRLRSITSRGSYTSFSELQLLHEGLATYELDTTSITQGEVPSKVYRVDESIEFNNANMLPLANTYTHDGALDILKSTRTFKTAYMAKDTTLKTKVKLSAVGNKMTSLDFTTIT
ncbi:MAG: hypothetical protein GQ474_10595, partial [Sulfurimonas sp.]|nr:hypothetical protein [Sulfurimonas sp.]